MEPWQKPETITLWIIIIVVFLILLLTFITLLIRLIFKKIARIKIAEVQAKIKYQKDLLKASITIQENERKRIASDLHDALIGKLIAIKIHQENNSDPLKYSKLIDNSIQMVRNISYDLSPPLLEYTTFSELIEDIAIPLRLNINITSKFDQRYTYDYTSDFKLQVIRILQETLNNIIKHANASSVVIHLRESKKNMFIKITDNGKGFNTQNKHSGLGLKNIQSRVQYLNGVYRIKSRTGLGTISLFSFLKPHI